MSFHKDQATGDIHRVNQFEYANAAARTGAVGLVATDVDKVAKQIDDDTYYVLIDDAPVTWKAITDVGPSAGRVDVITQAFLFSDGPTVDFGTLLNGDEIIETELEISVVFDDAAALVAVGQITNPSNILDTARTDPQTVGTYRNGENFPITAADGVRISITPGTSTQGTGRAVVTIRRA